MRRRELIFLLGGGLTTARILRAQQKPMPVIGYLAARSPGESASIVAAFNEGLSETGHVEEQNVTVEYRWAEGHYDRLPAMAADLVGRKVDVIAAGGFPSTLAAKHATSTIPIVFLTGTDPVEDGLIASLARPGGNLTGVSVLDTELMPKRLEVLSELVPHARAIALLVNPNNPSAVGVSEGAQEASRARGLQLNIIRASNQRDIEMAFASFAQSSVRAMVIQGDPYFNSQRDDLVARASSHAVPAIYAYREYVASGGLISYGASLTGMWRQVGIYVGKVLSGAKPADLPVEQLTKVELIINLKTANTLGLTIPPSILARADEIIE